MKLRKITIEDINTLEIKSDLSFEGTFIIINGDFVGPIKTVKFTMDELTNTVNAEVVIYEIE